MSVFGLHPPEPSEPRVLSFRESLDTNLLATESERVLHVVDTTLQRLQLTPAKYSSSSRTSKRPTLVLTLQLFSRFQQIEDTESSQVLSAFALLIAHSRRLDTFPELKCAFWLDVLRSRATVNDTRGVSKAELREPAFPVFAVDFRGYSFNSLPPYESLEDTLVSFLTTPPMLEPTMDRQDHAQLAVELCFANERPTSVSALEALERVFDRTFAHPTRQFTVSALDLSGNTMHHAELAVVARIAHKCRYVYHVSELRLDRINPRFEIFGYEPPAETPREFLDIMRAAYGFTHPPVLTAVGMGIAPAVLSDIPPAPSMLRSVSLKGNCVCLTYFAALLSALRHGSPIEEDFSQYVATSMIGTSKGTQSLSWLAFGLFYPRPKRFAKLLNLRNVGRLMCTTEVVEAFTKTLHNPATQLVYRGADPSGTNVAASEVLVCTVKKGASVELIELLKRDEPKPSFSSSAFDSPFGSVPVAPAPTQPAPTQPEYREISAQCELEGLCERESDRAVCVVIPGVGLGWVQRDSIEHIEREPLESAWKHQDGRYAIELECDRSNKGKEALRAMVALLGRQIHSLSFNCSGLNISVMPQILQHCVHLQHLSLQSFLIPESDLDALLEALSVSPLRTRLLSLNLNGNKFVSGTGVERLAALLASESSSGARLALRELRLHGVTLSVKAVAALRDALSTNRRLELLQLAHVDRLDNRRLSAKQELLCRTHDDQLLQPALPMAFKLAFLSTVRHAKSATSLRSLDENVLALIFRFASGRDVRRAIALTPHIDPPIVMTSWRLRSTSGEQLEADVDTPAIKQHEISSYVDQF